MSHTTRRPFICGNWKMHRTVSESLELATAATLIGVLLGVPMGVLAAVRQGTAVALANKESLVCAGALLREEARRSGARLLPIDSEQFLRLVLPSIPGVGLYAIDSPTAIR